MRKCLTILMGLIILLAGCSSDNSVNPKDKLVDWPSATPAESGLDAEQLNQAVQMAEQLGFVDGLLVVRHGKLVGEWYFNGYNAFDAHVIHSVSKSFLSALVGIALQRGELSGLDHKLMDELPEYLGLPMDVRIRTVTLDHLLTMRGGWDSDSAILYPMLNSLDWVEYTLRQTLVDDPGTAFHYATPQSHLIATMLGHAVDGSLKRYGTNHLFEPMGIACDQWKTDPQGHYTGGFGMYFTPRAMACLGQLYLQDGVWDGEVVVPSDWVETSTVTQAGGTGSWGRASNTGYARHWWTGNIDGNDFVMALGHAGQFIMIFRDLDMVVVATSRHIDGFTEADLQERQTLSVIADGVLPAVTE